MGDTSQPRGGDQCADSGQWRLCFPRPALVAAAATVLLSASPAGASGWTVVSPPSDGGFFNAVPGAPTPGPSAICPPRPR
jgi:hypothetical protein